MKKILIFPLLLCLFNLNAQDEIKPTDVLADDELDYSEVNENETFGKILKKKEVFLKDDILIEEVNPATQISQMQYYSGQDTKRLNINIQLSSDLTNLTEVLGFDGILGVKIGSDYWLDGLVSRTRAEFGAISENPSYVTSNPQAETNHPRAEGSNVDVIQFGMGLTLRTRFPQIFTTSEGMFQLISAYGLWNKIEDNSRVYDYQGPGFRADYAIQKRMTSRWHIGLRGTYHNVWGKRDPAFAGEISNHRRVNFSWVSLGFDTGLSF